MHVRPHPGPLPQERESFPPVSVSTAVSWLSIRPFAVYQGEAIATATGILSSSARSLFPLPGGEGQGEGERHNQLSNP